MNKKADTTLLQLIARPLTPEELPQEQLFQWLLQPRVPILFSDDPKTLQLIRAALRGESIRFVYLGGSTAGRVRKVSPAFLFMAEHDPTQYVYAFCHDRHAHRIFRLDRIESEFLFN